MCLLSQQNIYGANSSSQRAGWRPREGSEEEHVTARARQQCRSQCGLCRSPAPQAGKSPIPWQTLSPALPLGLSGSSVHPRLQVRAGGLLVLFLRPLTTVYAKPLLWELEESYRSPLSKTKLTVACPGPHLSVSLILSHSVSQMRPSPPRSQQKVGRKETGGL